MGSDASKRRSIQSLIDDGTIIGHKDGNYGSSYPRASEFGMSGVPLLTAKAVDDGGRIDFASAARLNGKKASTLSYGFIETDDVLLSHNATVGRVALVPELDEPVLVGTSLTYFRVDPSKLLPKYLAAFFRGEDFQRQLQAVMSHSTRNQVPITTQRQLSVVVPPLPEQRAIAEVLGSLDDKIELNRRMNRTLDSMARAWFKSWFVDFGPVHANAAGKPSLPADFAAQFPSAFETSPLGDIPEGWEVRGLDKIADYLNGLALQKYPAELGKPTLPRLKIAQLRKGDTKGAELSNTKVPDCYVINDGDVIFSWSGSLLVRIWTGGKAALNQHLFKVTSDEFPRWFYYLWTKHHLEDFQATAASKATTMGHIKRRHLSDAKVVLPRPDVLEAAGKVIGPLHEQLVTNDLETRTLAALRDALLPKLLSGELRVEGLLPGSEGGNA